MKNFNITLPNWQKHIVEISENGKKISVYRNNFSGKIRRIINEKFIRNKKSENKNFFVNEEVIQKLQEKNNFLQQELDKKTLENSEQKDKIENLNQEIEKLMKQVHYFHNNYKENFEESQKLKLQLQQFQDEIKRLNENKKLETKNYRIWVLLWTLINKYWLTIEEAEEILKNFFENKKSENQSQENNLKNH